MNRELPINFFVGVINAFLIVIPFYMSLYWFGVVAILIYFVGCVLLVCSIKFVSTFEEKRSKKNKRD